MATRLVDPSRYRALVRVIGGVLGVLVAIDVALRLAVGISPAALLRASFHDTGNRELVAARVSAVIAERGAGPVAVIVGSSSAYDGLLPSVLAGADPAHRRWLNLATTGSSFDELRYTFGPLFASELDPDLVVVAIHPGWMAGRLVGDPTLDAILISSTAPRTSWLLFNRGLVNHAVRDGLADAREWLLLRLGVPFDAVYPPARDPWSEHAPAHGERDLAFARDQMEMWRLKRWFDASWFAHADEEVAAAAEVIAAAQRVARRVVVVLMPESSTLRAAMPGEAEAAFRRALTRLAAPPPVLDLRAVIPDALFEDHIHVGDRGAHLLSAALAERLAER
jgi:hypothetical protein